VPVRGKWKAVVPVVLAMVVVLALAGSASRLLANHRDFGVWSLSVHSPTPKVAFQNRRYDRLSIAPAVAHRERIGTTSDGHPVFAPAGAPTPPPLLVIDIGGRVVGYRLEGGT
jgi:hypothetical protein